MSLAHRFQREDAEKALADQFETFWRAYPRRVGKGAARKAFAAAIRLTTLETMLAAIDAYVRCKPGYADFCHPSTWLNQERWEDEWEVSKPRNYADFARGLFTDGSASGPAHHGHDERLPAIGRRH